MQAGTRFTYPGGMEAWVDLVDLIAPRPGVEPATFRSRVQRSTSATTKTTSSVLQEHMYRLTCWIFGVTSYFQDGSHYISCRCRVYYIYSHMNTAASGSYLFAENLSCCPPPRPFGQWLCTGISCLIGLSFVGMALQHYYRYYLGHSRNVVTVTINAVWWRSNFAE